MVYGFVTKQIVLQSDLTLEEGTVLTVSKKELHTCGDKILLFSADEIKYCCDSGSLVSISEEGYTNIAKIRESLSIVEERLRSTDVETNLGTLADTLKLLSKKLRQEYVNKAATINYDELDY